MGTRITAPLEGYSQTTRIGDLQLEFKDSIAETDRELSEGHALYLQSRGYKVAKTRSKAAAEDHPDPLPGADNLPGDGVPLDEVPDGVEDAADQDANGVSDEQEGMEVDEADVMPQTPKARARKSRRK